MRRVGVFQSKGPGPGVTKRWTRLEPEGAQVWMPGRLQQLALLDHAPKSVKAILRFFAGVF